MIDIALYEEGYREGMESQSGDTNPYLAFSNRARGWNAGARDARAQRREAAIEERALALYDELCYLVDALSEWGDINCAYDAQKLIHEIEEASR
jgi:ribosome modulation factor